MTGYKLILIGIGLIIVFGVIYPFFAGFFIDTNNFPTSGIASNITGVIDNGITLDIIPIDGWGEFDINPFSWLGQDVQDYVSDTITILGGLPVIILYPLILIISLCIILGFVSIIRGN